MLTFLLHEKIIPDCQHGFLPGPSTITNMLVGVNYWTLALDSEQPLDIAYLDFSKDPQRAYFL